jgi:hypothetical protein
MTLRGLCFIKMIGSCYGRRVRGKCKLKNGEWKMQSECGVQHSILHSPFSIFHSSFRPRHFGKEVLVTQPLARRWQFSLLTLLIAMSGIALVCLALRSPNELWATAIFAAAVLSLGFAALAAVYRSGRTRAFALGFVVFGAGYWTLAFVADGTYYATNGMQQRLPTTRWSMQLFALLHKDSVETQAVMAPVYQTTVYTQPYASTPTATLTPALTYVPQQIQRPRYSADVFNDISHQSLVMLLGVLGGALAQWLYSTRKDEPSPSAPPAV